MTSLATSIRLSVYALLLFGALPSGGRAQEFIDTLGRWKELDLSGVSTSGAMPRSIIAHQGMILIGRERGSILRGIDSGETWAEVGAGKGAPANLMTTWDLTFLDTTSEPGHLFGIARFDGGAPYGAMIESTDGGVTWKESTPLPFLNAHLARPVDSLMMYGRPQLEFLRDTVTNARVGFLWCGVGLWRSTDTGRTWVKDPNIAAVYDLWMIDSRYGAGFVKLNGDIYLGDIASTQNGGATWRSILRIPDDQWRFPMGYAFERNSIRILIADRHKNLSRWMYFYTDDRGNQFRKIDHASSRRPLWGTAIWLDTADIHVVGDGMSLQHSPNGAWDFFLLRDTLENYIQNDLLVYVLPKAPISARDHRYIYSAGPNDRAFRWRYAEPGPRLQASTPLAARNSAIERHGDILVAPDDSELSIVDLLGRVVLSSADGHLSLGPLSAGPYLAVVRSRKGEVKSMGIIVE